MKLCLKRGVQEQKLILLNYTGRACMSECRFSLTLSLCLEFHMNWGYDIVFCVRVTTYFVILVNFSLIEYTSIKLFLLIETMSFSFIVNLVWWICYCLKCNAKTKIYVYSKYFTNWTFLVSFLFLTVLAINPVPQNRI